MFHYLDAKPQIDKIIQIIKKDNVEKDCFREEKNKRAVFTVVTPNY